MAVIIMAVIPDCSICGCPSVYLAILVPFYRGTFVRRYTALLLYDTPAHVYWEMRGFDCKPPLASLGHVFRSSRLRSSVKMTLFLTVATLMAVLQPIMQ